MDNDREQLNSVSLREIVKLGRARQCESVISLMSKKITAFPIFKYLCTKGEIKELLQHMVMKCIVHIKALQLVDNFVSFITDYPHGLGKGDASS